MATGGLTRPIAEAASAAMDKVYNTLEDRGWQLAIDAFMSMRRSFQQHPLGPHVENMIEKGIMNRQQSTSRLRAPINQFENLAKQDSQLALMHNYKTATVGQIHASLPQGHPAKQALAPVVQFPSNHNLTLEDMRHIAAARANLEGRTAAFGPDSSYLATVLSPMYNSGNPTDRSLADAWLDIASQVFRDTKGTYDEGKLNKASGIKEQVADFVNARRRLQGLPELGIHTETTYVPASGLERGFQHYTMNVLAPWIAAVHTSDLFKLPANFNGAILMRTLTTLNDPVIKAMRDRSGIYNHTLHSIYDNDFMYRTGKLAHFTQMPELAAIIHKIYHQPLFNNLRMFQHSVFGTAAYHAAQEWGWKAYQGDQFAIDNLKDLRLDVNAIIRRGGQLTRDELEQAVFHYTNNQMFIDNPLERSKLAVKSPFFRIAYLLHGYATKEGRLMARTLYKAMRNNEYTKIAQWFAVVGLVFPFFAAPAIKSLGKLLRTGDPKEALEDYKGTYENLLHPDGIGNFAYTYFDLAAHFAGIGAFTNMLHSAVNLRAATALLGAAPGAIITTGEEALRTGWDIATGKNYKPEMRKGIRDALRYTFPVFGSIADHWLFPPKRRPKALRQLRSRRF